MCEEQEEKMEKLFKFRENGTNPRTEVIAGVTTFMTMAYIIALNPNILAGGQEQSLWNGVFLATCIASALAMFVMGFLANKPFALAPGLGLNSFFAVVSTNIAAIIGCSYLEAYQAALCIIFVEGIVFMVLSIFNVREKIVEAIPLGIRLGISPAIGMLLLKVGLTTSIYGAEGSWNPLQDFFSALTPGLARDSVLAGGGSWGELCLIVITLFIGLFAIIVLAQRGIKAAVILGMLIACAVYWICEAVFMGVNPFAGLAGASFVPAFGDMAQTTLFKLNFHDFFQIGWFTGVTLIITFCIIDMFDTIGTLVGTASRANMLDEEGKMPQMKEAMISDAIGTVAGSVTGTSTVTTFVESSSGVAAGGRTGLTAITTGILFLACIFIAPVAAIIPSAATGSALLYVGFLMIGGLKKVDFDDICQLVPVAIMLIVMPFTGSIGHGIGLGMICYTVIKIFTGKAKEVSILTYIISIIFAIKFFLVV